MRPLDVDSESSSSNHKALFPTKGQDVAKHFEIRCVGIVWGVFQDESLPLYAPKHLQS